jgi:S-adenosylmethionine/arginine decarboxylase-like enzyme
MNIAKSHTLPKNPMAYYCDMSGNRGATGVGILETSHCALHSWDEGAPAKLAFDLYSCADFKLEDVVHLCNTFGILAGSYMLIDRDTELYVKSRGVIDAGGVIHEEKSLTYDER